MMETKKWSALLLAVLLFTVPLAYAEGPCTLETITGTYVMHEKGSALAIDLVNQAAPPTWVAPMLAPFGNITYVTFTPDGAGTGFYWLWVGSYKPILDPVPFTVSVLELGADCTGKIEYTTTVPGAPAPVTIRERVVVTDNGKTIYTVPISIVNGVPTQAWIGTAHRISKGTEPVDWCGPQTSHGTYLLRCENIVKSPANPNLAIADTMLVRMKIAMSGDYEATLFEKMGPVSIDGHQVWGTITVNANCSFSGTFNADGVAGTVVQKGVFFDEGKQLYATAILNTGKPLEQQGMKYSLCEGNRIGE